MQATAVQVIGSSKEMTENKLYVSDFSTLFLISNWSHASNMVWVIEG